MKNKETCKICGIGEVDICFTPEDLSFKMCNHCGSEFADVETMFLDKTLYSNFKKNINNNNNLKTKEKEEEYVASINDICYSHWRRSEAYMLPMTQEGVEAAEQRFKQFKVGFDSGIKACMLVLEKEHSKNKKIHSFFLIAKELIDKIRK